MTDRSQPNKKEACIEFLKTHDYGVVATAANDNVPWAATIAYLVDDDLAIYFATRAHTTKAQHLQENPNIAMAVGFGPEAKAVQILGTAEKLESEAHDHWFTEMLVKKDAYYNIFLKMEGYDIEIYKIVPNQIRWMEIDDENQAEIFTNIL